MDNRLTGMKLGIALLPKTFYKNTEKKGLNSEKKTTTN